MFPQNDMTGTVRFVLVVNVLAVSQDNPQGRAALVVRVWRSQIGPCLSSADAKVLWRDGIVKEADAMTAKRRRIAKSICQDWPVKIL